MNAERSFIEFNCAILEGDAVHATSSGSIFIREDGENTVVRGCTGCEAPFRFNGVDCSDCEINFSCGINAEIESSMCECTCREPWGEEMFTVCENAGTCYCTECLHNELCNGGVYLGDMECACDCTVLGPEFSGINCEICSGVDTDSDGICDIVDECDDDPDKSEPGLCGCGSVENVGDEDSDGTINCNDVCPIDPLKDTDVGCGCGLLEMGDSDSDGTNDCIDVCPFDENKSDDRGICGCGSPDVDTDGDMTFDCFDGCKDDPFKIEPGQCGCGNEDVDGDSDGTADCNDVCPLDPLKVDDGDCGCGVQDTDQDSDGVANCLDDCPLDPERFKEPCRGTVTFTLPPVVQDNPDNNDEDDVVEIQSQVTIEENSHEVSLDVFMNTAMDISVFLERIDGTRTKFTNF